MTLFTGLLVHRCTIQRRSAGVDRFMQPVDEWEDVATDVPCRLSSKTRGEEATGDSGRDVVEVFKTIYFPDGTDVTEKDKVVDVVAPDGETLLDSGDVSLVRVVAKGAGARHHLEVVLRQVRSEDA